MLEAKDLTKSYSGVTAVNNVNFRLGQGQVLGCLGPNGSGKSTTVKMLTGLLEPTRGKVLLEGCDIQSDLVGFRRNLGYVPEEPNLYPYLSAYEYLEIVGTLRGIDGKKLSNKIDSLLESFSLYSHRHASMGSYSKGMRQRVLLIAALMDDPKLLILDEPLSGLDVTTALIVKTLIKALGTMGRAIFYCSHVLEVVEQVCTHLLILRKGNVLAYDSTKAIQNGMQRSTLEGTFIQMVEDTDADRVASGIISAMEDD